jgi:hypothetical protein
MFPTQSSGRDVNSSRKTPSNPSAPQDPHQLLDAVEAGAGGPLGAAARPAVDEEHEVSVEQYMQSLLNRYRSPGPTYSAPPPPPSPSPPAATQSPNVADAAVRTAEVYEPADPDRPQTSQELEDDQEGASSSLPVRAPECRNGLSTMREVANANARAAIEAHAHRILSRRVCSKLFVATLAIVTSAILSTVSESVLSLAFASAALTLVVGIMATVQFFRLTTLLVVQAHKDGVFVTSQRAELAADAAEAAA